MGQQMNETLDRPGRTRAPGLSDAFGDLLRRPLTIRAAIVLLIAHLVAVGVLLDRQSATLERIERQASFTSEVAAPFPDADPEACWLVGAAAYVDGRGPALVAQLASAPLLSACVHAAHEGAMGRSMAR